MPIKGGRGRRPPTTVGWQKKDCPFMWCKNIAGRFFGLVKKHACDGWTDVQNYDSKDRAGIAAPRGKNVTRV